MKAIGPTVATKYDRLKHKEGNSDYVHLHEPNDVRKATVTDTTWSTFNHYVQQCVSFDHKNISNLCKITPTVDRAGTRNIDQWEPNNV